MSTLDAILNDVTVSRRKFIEGGLLGAAAVSGLFELSEGVNGGISVGLDILPPVYCESKFETHDLLECSKQVSGASQNHLQKGVFILGGTALLALIE